MSLKQGHLMIGNSPVALVTIWVTPLLISKIKPKGREIHLSFCNSDTGSLDAVSRDENPKKIYPPWDFQPICLGPWMVQNGLTSPRCILGWRHRPMVCKSHGPCEQELDQAEPQREGEEILLDKEMTKNWTTWLLQNLKHVDGAYPAALNHPACWWFRTIDPHVLCQRNRALRGVAGKLGIIELNSDLQLSEPNQDAMRELCRILPSEHAVGRKRFPELGV